MKTNLFTKASLLLLSIFALAGCTPAASSSAASSSAAASSSTAPVSSSSAVSSSTESSSSSSDSSSSSSDVCVNPDYTPAIDYVSQVHLAKEYLGKSFLTDGIGQVTLVQKVDGDTAHFKQVSGSTLTIKGRYNCIDTPESTGMVEPWGHGASEYNGSLLASAQTIVLSTDSTATKAPALDSTGSRYLVYVWVSTKANAAIGDLILSNLAICQAGWSKAKGATNTDYGSYFIKASSQAQSAQVRVWSPSSVKDCDYNYSAPETTSIKNIVDGVDNDGNAFDWVGSKATFTGIVCATGPDQGAAFVNQDFTWTENGTSVTKRYGIYIFTSYIVYRPLKTIGNEIQVTGLVAEFEGIKQIVSVSYSEYYPSDDDMKILSTGKTLAPIEGTAKELAVDQNINVVVKTTLKCTRGYATQNAATQTAYSFTLYCEDTTGELNIYIVDSLFIQDARTTVTTRVQSVDYFTSATSITLTGGLVTYTTKAGVKTYQVKLCKAADLVVTF